MPPSPAASLFASDYSLSAPPSPAATRTSPRPSPSYRPLLASRSTGNLSAPAITSPLKPKPLDVVFDTDDIPGTSISPPPLLSPNGTTDSDSSPLDSPLDHSTLPTLGKDDPPYTKTPNLISGSRKKSSIQTIDDKEHFFSDVKSLDARRKSSARTIPGYETYEGCMEGGLGHENKAGTYKLGTEKAYHHLNRANELFGSALSIKPTNPRGMLARSKVLIQLAMNYQPPKTATASLKEATTLLRNLIRVAPKSVTAREALAQACALLSSTMLETDDSVDDEVKLWEGQIGQLAREALQCLEDVAADKMDRMRELKQAEAAEQAPGMAETFLALSAAAVTVSTLANDLHTVDVHVELAEQALDQASNMATVAASARVKSSTSSANLITRVQLASGRSSLERLRHTFILGVDLDEDDFRSLMSDMSILADECRERVAKLKGSKQASASTLAWESVKQLGEAKLLYANLLRLVWPKRRPKRKTSKDGNSRKLSSRSDNAEATIAEEDEDVLSDGWAIRRPSGAVKGRRESDVRRESDGAKNQSRKGSTLDALSESEQVSTFTTTPPRYRDSFSIPSSGRRGSWLPSNASGNSDMTIGRGRRLSSMSAPLVGPDGISAWSRKASVISLAVEDEASGLVPSGELAHSAWQLLEKAAKQFKLALTLLSTCDLPAAQLARAKTETLKYIGYCSLFMASLSARVSIASDKKTSLLVSSEVYITWAAREVGWSFLIEGTRESQLADRRTNSWRADEVGKRAVMLLVRIWWHRAVTTESMDVDTKTAAKDAVEVVVRRMKDREGVRDGDVVRFKNWLGRMEGEMDAAETLFWRSVSRILRGGQGFVMS